MLIDRDKGECKWYQYMFREYINVREKIELGIMLYIKYEGNIPDKVEDTRLYHYRYGGYIVELIGFIDTGKKRIDFQTQPNIIEFDECRKGNGE